MKAKFILLMLIVGALLTQAVFAKEMPQKVTISAPDAAWQIEIVDDRELIEALMSFSLEDYTTRSSQPPEGVGSDSYLISRYHLNDAGEYALLDASRYYPNPDDTAPGFLFYEGRVNAPSEWDNQWYTADPANEAQLLSLIRDEDAAPEVQSNALRPLLQMIARLLVTI